MKEFETPDFNEEIKKEEKLLNKRKIEDTTIDELKDKFIKKDFKK